MKPRWRVLSLVGIGCSSLCFLALPLLLIWAPAVGFGWLHNETLTRGMLLMFLAMSLAGSFGAYRVHRRLAPGLMALTGAFILIGGAWHVVRHWLGWLALAAIAAAWAWDQRLIKGAHHAHDHSHCEDPGEAS